MDHPAKGHDLDRVPAKLMGLPELVCPCHCRRGTLHGGTCMTCRGWHERYGDVLPVSSPDQLRGVIEGHYRADGVDWTCGEGLST